MTEGKAKAFLGIGPRTERKITRQKEVENKTDGIADKSRRHRGYLDRMDKHHIKPVLQYGLYVVFVHAVKVPPVPSTLISYSISFIFNFFLSSYFTFRSRPNAKKGLGFTLSHLINMGLQTGLVAIFKGIVGPTLALLPAIGISFPINYALVRFVFNSDRFQSK